MTIDFGNELFAIGTLNRLVLFERGCHIKTTEHNVFARWEEINCIRAHGHKQTMIGFTYSKKLTLLFEMNDSRTIKIEFVRLGFLWGIEFLYHNQMINKLFKTLTQHGVPIK